MFQRDKVDRAEETFHEKRALRSSLQPVINLSQKLKKDSERDSFKIRLSFWLYSLTEQATPTVDMKKRNQALLYNCKEIFVVRFDVMIF